MLAARNEDVLQQIVAEIEAAYAVVDISCAHLQALVELRLCAITGTDAEVAIVDISMDEMDGIELTRRLKEEDPDLRVLILSMHDDTYYVRAALEAGASGYVSKERIHKEILDAVSAVLEGRTYLSEDVKEKLD